ncbi:MAG TPA: hypothetical protein VGJ20_16655 [Xanthobacteraceae bacterium]|jgi:hypothetical protein
MMAIVHRKKEMTMLITDKDGTSWLSGKITPSGMLEEALGCSKLKISNSKYEVTQEENTFTLSKSMVQALLKESGDLRMALKMCVTLLEKIEDTIPCGNGTLHACDVTLAYAKAVLKYKLSDHAVERTGTAAASALAGRMAVPSSGPPVVSALVPSQNTSAS